MLQMLCAILAIGFLVQELYNYQIGRPKFIATQKMGLSSDIYPGISLCLEPTFNIEVINQHGYPGVFGFYKWLNKKDDLIGWGGDEALSQEKLLKSLVLHNTTHDIVNSTIVEYIQR